MRVVVTSLLGLSLLSSMAWAVETAPAPSVASAVPATTAAPVLVQGSTTQPKIIPAVATVSPTGQPQEAKPLTAEQLAKTKHCKMPKSKHWSKTKLHVLHNWKKPISMLWRKTKSFNSKMIASVYKFRSYKANVVRKCSSTVRQPSLLVYYWVS